MSGNEGMGYGRFRRHPLFYQTANLVLQHKRQNRLTLGLGHVPFKDSHQRSASAFSAVIQHRQQRTHVFGGGLQVRAG